MTPPLVRSERPFKEQKILCECKNTRNVRVLGVFLIASSAFIFWLTLDYRCKLQYTMLDRISALI